MKKPTKEDAEILLRMFQTQSSPQNFEAGTWFFKEFSAKDYEEFKSKYPVGSDGFSNVGTVLSSFETAGALVSHGLLNENLYFDVSGIEFAWQKIGHIMSDWQKDTDPALWENAVWLAERQKEWKKKVWKPGLKWKLAARSSSK